MGKFSPKGTERESGLGSLDERLHVPNGKAWDVIPISAPQPQFERKAPLSTVVVKDRISASSQEHERNVNHELLKEIQQTKILLQLALESKLREHPNNEDRQHLVKLEKEIKELQNRISISQKPIEPIPIKEHIIVKEVAPAIIGASPKPSPGKSRSNLPKSAFSRQISTVHIQNLEANDTSDDYDTIPLSKPRIQPVLEASSSEEEDDRNPVLLPPSGSEGTHSYDDEQDDTSQDEEPTPPKLPPPRIPPEVDDMINRAIPLVMVEKVCVPHLKLCH